MSDLWRLLLQESQTGCGPEIDGRRRSLHGRHHGTGVRQARPQERLNSADVAVVAGDVTCNNKIHLIRQQMRVAAFHRHFHFFFLQFFLILTLKIINFKN